MFSISREDDRVPMSTGWKLSCRANSTISCLASTESLQTNTCRRQWREIRGWGEQHETRHSVGSLDCSELITWSGAYVISCFYHRLYLWQHSREKTRRQGESTGVLVGARLSARWAPSSTPAHSGLFLWLSQLFLHLKVSATALLLKKSHVWWYQYTSFSL